LGSRERKQVTVPWVPNVCKKEKDRMSVCVYVCLYAYMCVCVCMCVYECMPDSVTNHLLSVSVSPCATPQAEAVLQRHGFAVAATLDSGVASVRLVRPDGSDTEAYLRSLDAAKRTRAHAEAASRPAPPSAPACVAVDNVASRAFATAEPLAQLGAWSVCVRNPAYMLTCGQRTHSAPLSLSLSLSHTFIHTVNHSHAPLHAHTHAHTYTQSLTHSLTRTYTRTCMTHTC
jgi:hypothetical protein